MFIINPDFSFTILGSMALVTVTRPLQLVLIIVSQSSKYAWWAGSRPSARPALLIKTSILFENKESTTSILLLKLKWYLKINRISVENIDGTNESYVNVGIDKATITSSATWEYLSGALFKIANTVSVPADAVLVLLDTPIYLEEGDVLEGGASAASDLTLFVSYEVIDDA